MSEEDVNNKKWKTESGKQKIRNKKCELEKIGEVEEVEKEKEVQEEEVQQRK